MYLFNVLLAILTIYLAYRLKNRGSKLPLPPGPRGFPLVGHLFSIPSAYEWITYHRWCKELGTNILHLNMMGQSIIVLDNAEVVAELLEKRSSKYSSRLSFPFFHDLLDGGYNTGALKYGTTWRRHRRLSHAFFGSQAQSNYRPVTLRASRNLMVRLIDNSENIKGQIHYMAGEIVMALCYGLDVATEDGLHYLQVVIKGVEGLLETAIPGKFLVDFVPVLKYVPGWVPGAGFQKKARVWKKYINEMINLPFGAAKKNWISGTCPPCFVCSSLQAGAKSDSDDVNLEEVVKNAAGTLYGAGADTTTATISSCILGLLGRPEVLKRAREDLDRVIKPGRLPDFDDELSLPFITAITKEALRWREVAPLGVPHYIEEEDEYAGYRIPAGSVIMANQWSMLHDENLYPDPFMFKPERFMKGDEYNHEVKDPEYACFGFGRRICPGKFMAFSSIWITIASLIYVFDIENEIDEDGCPIEPNPRYTTGIVFSPEPFPCRFNPRSEELVKLVRASIGQEL